MRFSDRMRYPHPVLSDISADYSSGEFHCSFEQQLTPEGELRLTSDLALDSGELAALVTDQWVAAGYFVVCRETYFNVLQPATLGKTEKFFDASSLFGAVVIRPVLWTLERVDRLSSPALHPEFGQEVGIPKGSVVALGPEFRFSVDKRKFKPFESIFELAPLPGIEPGAIKVDAMTDRITIHAEPATFRSISDMRNGPMTRDLLLSTVYMPAVMDVLSSLQNDGAGLVSRSWYRVFKAKCDDLGIDPTDRMVSPLELAQKLLRLPFKRVISVVERL